MSFRGHVGTLTAVDVTLDRTHSAGPNRCRFRLRGRREQSLVPASFSSSTYLPERLSLQDLLP